MSEGICVYRFQIQTEITNTGWAVVCSTASGGSEMITMSLDVFIIAITCPAAVAALATWYYIGGRNDED